MKKRKCRCGTDLEEARSAMNEAAKVIAQLAAEVPPVRPISKPTNPIKPNRPVPVFPTGHHKQDVANLEQAIMKAGKGGIVLLKAKDKSGKKRHFDLSAVTDLSLPFEVSLKSEKDTVIRFSN
jgi:hypothetical protein